MCPDFSLQCLLVAGLLFHQTRMEDNNETGFKMWARLMHGKHEEKTPFERTKVARVEKLHPIRTESVLGTKLFWYIYPCFIILNQYPVHKVTLSAHGGFKPNPRVPSVTSPPVFSPPTTNSLSL
jgi:hypothetical protein